MVSFYSISTRHLKVQPNKVLMLNRWRVTCWRIIRTLNTHIYTRTHSCTYGLLRWASHKHSISTISAAPPVRQSVAFSLFFRCKQREPRRFVLPSLAPSLHGREASGLALFLRDIRAQYSQLSVYPSKKGSRKSHCLSKHVLEEYRSTECSHCYTRGGFPRRSLSRCWS